MVKNSLPLLIGLILLLNPTFAEQNLLKTGAPLCLGSRLYAQTPYKRYEDRTEGLIKPRQLVSGEKLDLLAAAIENSEPAPNPATADYNLGFYLKDSTRVDIVVREFKLDTSQEIYLRWNGKDQGNKPAKDGLYKLLIEATFKPLPGEIREK